MQMTNLQMGTMTAGVIAVASSTRIVAVETTQFHLDLTLRGRVATGRSGAQPMVTERGAGVLFSPEQIPDNLWSDNTDQMCLKIPRETLESEIEVLLGRVVKTPIGRHLGGLVLDGLLLGHPHNYSELVDQPAPAAETPVGRAIELLEALPEHPWTTVRLAQEVHLSVRAPRRPGLGWCLGGPPAGSGRFSATYSRRYGENPSATVARLPS